MSTEKKYSIWYKPEDRWAEITIIQNSNNLNRMSYSKACKELSTRDNTVFEVREIGPNDEGIPIDKVLTMTKEQLKLLNELVSKEHKRLDDEIDRLQLELEKAKSARGELYKLYNAVGMIKVS